MAVTAVKGLNYKSKQEDLEILFYIPWILQNVVWFNAKFDFWWIVSNGFIIVGATLISACLTGYIFKT